ncbi:hypothetical protein F5880DRAFT_1227034 [Lentinula raphanica]|nr:hypothetical protein F5880DRAFT_1227034 [Lentinula raphanica]
MYKLGQASGKRHKRTYRYLESDGNYRKFQNEPFHLTTKFPTYSIFPSVFLYHHHHHPHSNSITQQRARNAYRYHSRPHPPLPRHNASGSCQASYRAGDGRTASTSLSHQCLSCDIVACTDIHDICTFLQIQTSPGKNTNPTHSGKAEVKSGQGDIEKPQAPVSFLAIIPGIPVQRANSHMCFVRDRPPQNVQIPISTTSASASSKGRVPSVVANVFPRPIMSPSSLLPIVFLVISHTSSKRSLPCFGKMCWGLTIVLSSSCIATRSIIPG